MDNSFFFFFDLLKKFILPGSNQFVLTEEKNRVRDILHHHYAHYVSSQSYP